MIHQYLGKIYLTPSGLESYKRRKKEFQKLREATKDEHDELLKINQKIEEIELILKNYELIQAPPKDKQDAIDLGATVVLEIDGQTDEFTIVGTLEVNPSAGKISNESPVGKALLGRRVGDEITISSPIKIIYKIKAIRYDL